jgi:hypothetical protein
LTKIQSDLNAHGFFWHPEHFVSATEGCGEQLRRPIHSHFPLLREIVQVAGAANPSGSCGAAIGNSALSTSAAICPGFPRFREDCNPALEHLSVQKGGAQNQFENIL